MSKLFKSVIAAIAIGVLGAVVPVHAVECPSLELNQLYVLQYSYNRGADEGIPMTLAAIALVESEAGVHLVNNRSKDYGVYQNNRKTLCKQAGYGYYTAACSREVKRVTNNITLAADHAIETFNWWMDYHKNRTGSDKEAIELAVRSYNAGFNYDSKKATNYWKNFYKAYNMLDKCVRFD